jgi:ATP-dependent HslUV protease ATP-binding subunit HslU
MFANIGGQQDQAAQAQGEGSRSKLLVEEEAGKLVNEEELRAARAEQCRAERHRVHRRESTRSRAARTSTARTCPAKGVQRDLLPLVEGSTVSTEVRADQDGPHPVHRLGAFHMSKPSDLIPSCRAASRSASSSIR